MRDPTLLKTLKGNSHSPRKRAFVRCVCLPHTNSSPFLDEERNLQVWEKYTRWGAVFPGKFVPVLTLGADCSLVTSKSAYLSPYLPKGYPWDAVVNDPKSEHFLP